MPLENESDGCCTGVKYIVTNHEDEHLNNGRNIPLDKRGSLSLEDAKAARRKSLYGPHENRRILKNLIVLGFSFTLLFSAYMATANLQSSINSEGSLGTYALALLYITTVISSLLLPPLVMYTCKIKVTMVASILGYMGYVAAQFYASYATLIPAALFLGICGAHLWAAAQTYMAKIAEEYAYLRRQTNAAVLQNFFGIFFLFFHSSQIWGNLISSSVLSMLSENSGMSNDTSPALNFKTITTSIANPSATYGHCGPHFCTPSSASKELENSTGNNLLDEAVSANLTRPDDSKIYLLFGIFLGCTAAAGFMIFFFVDSLIRYGELELKTKSKPKATGLLIATVRHWKKPTQLLIIPVTVWLGIQEAFIGADFTVAFISCAWGVQNIGFVMMCFGICASISSLIIGKLMSWIGRPALFIMAGLLDLCCMIILLSWTPNPNQPWIFFLVSGLWGLGDGVWSPQVKALYGAIFPNTAEAAFSNAVLWTSIGFIIVYSLAGKLCMALKLYIYIGVLIFSMICYVMIEVIERRKHGPKKSRRSSSGSNGSVGEEIVKEKK